jgi:uncharacterized Zn finger protein (UPF0148 family)
MEIYGIMYLKEGEIMIEEICIGCKWVEFLYTPGESFLVCNICEENTEDKSICFEERMEEI